MIPCSIDCKYQKDGCCELENATTVKNVNCICPHYERRMSDKGNSLTDSADIYKLN